MTELGQTCHAGSMRKRTGKRPPEPDFNQLAHHLVRMTTEEAKPLPIPINSKRKTHVSPEVSRVMAEMGRRGGKLGGRQRAANMTKEERSDAAALAARVRWKKAKGTK